MDASRLDIFWLLYVQYPKIDKGASCTIYHTSSLHPTGCRMALSLTLVPGFQAQSGIGGPLSWFALNPSWQKQPMLDKMRKDGRIGWNKINILGQQYLRKGVYLLYYEHMWLRQPDMKIPETHTLNRIFLASQKGLILWCHDSLESQVLKTQCMKSQ